MAVHARRISALTALPTATVAIHLRLVQLLVRLPYHGLIRSKKINLNNSIIG